MIFSCRSPGQKTERLARFHRGARENDAVDLLLLQRRHGHRDGQISLAGAGRADAEDDVVLLDRLDIIPLAQRARHDRRLARRGDDLVVDHVA